ncbi:MAG TPA: hypothetical protein PKV52_04210 [Candidatus Saccharibacteria bacterium]|nr:hypothetical protein [Candidatus Saccharibacteria bacterium]
MIISVKEARKILGKDYEKLTDEEVEKLIYQLHNLAKASLEMARKQRLEKTLGETTPEN